MLFSDYLLTRCINHSATRAVRVYGEIWPIKNVMMFSSASYYLFPNFINERNIFVENVCEKNIFFSVFSVFEVKFEKDRFKKSLLKMVNSGRTLTFKHGDVGSIPDR